VLMEVLLSCIGGVLAHAFYPQNGETHFDDEEQWVDREHDGIDLMTVTAHELGHALGLGHSEVPGALMAPYYQGYEPNFSLPDDDRQAIRSLYGMDFTRICRIVLYRFFLPRDAMLSAVYAVVMCPSVRPSVCVSVTLRYCIKMAKRRIMPPDNPVTLVF